MTYIHDSHSCSHLREKKDYDSHTPFLNWIERRNEMDTVCMREQKSLGDGSRLGYVCETIKIKKIRETILYNIFQI